MQQSSANEAGPSLTVRMINIEVLAGLTVALALIPEAVAFAFVARVEPLVGLYAAFIVGLITAILGGRPGMISGATGALAVVMVSLVATHGVEYLFATVVLMGVIQIIAGVMRWGKFIRMVPHPVMLGFVNGLAIVIFLAQMSNFKVANAKGDQVWMTGQELALTLGFVGLTVAIIFLVPRLTKSIPAPLVAIVSVTSLVLFFDLDLASVGDLASVAGGLPEFHIPTIPLDLASIKVIFPYAVILASIGLIESLLTLNLVSELTETKGGASKECAAQGVANVVTGFFGGMGGCAMIGQSMINIESGARTRLSAISASLFLLGFILFGSSLIERIPLAALVGVMFTVVIGTFAWRSFNIMHRIPKQDAFVMVLVTGVTVYSDLAVAVIVGVIVSALGYAWSQAKHIHAETTIDQAGQKIYTIEGPLFFGSTTGFQDLFNPKGDPDEVVIDFKDSRVMDYSGLQVIDSLAVRYETAGKNLHLRHLSPDCKKLLHRAGKLVEVSIQEDPQYEVAVDYSEEFA